MSARDSASGSSDWHGGGGSFGNGGGGTANGGIGGGQGGGGWGGGAGYNGGYQSRQGLSTGNTMYGNSAFGRPGGMAQAYGTRDARSLAAAGMGPTQGTFGQFRTMQGSPMFPGSPVQGQSFQGMNMGQALAQAQQAQQAWQAAQPPQTGGLLGPSTPNVQPTSGPVDQPYNPLSSVQPPPYNPLVDVQPGLPTLGGLSYHYNMQMAPGQRPGNAWGGGGLAGLNRPANRGPSTGTSSYPSTNGGYPSLGARDTRPAGVY